MRSQTTSGAVALLIAAAVVFCGALALAAQSAHPATSAGTPFALVATQAKAVEVNNATRLEVHFTTKGNWDVGTAEQAQAQFCVEGIGATTTTAICLASAGITRTVRRNGAIVGSAVLSDASWSHGSSSTLALSVPVSELGLKRAADNIRWRASTKWVGTACLATGCTSDLPRKPHTSYSTPLQIGATPRCVPRGPAKLTSGSNGTKAVALGIDDGPGTYTDAFINTLNKLGAHATFYVIGRQIAGHEAVLRKMLKSGDEIGNHTWAHQPGIGLGETVTAIKRATHGWRPCTYRPPEGKLGGWQAARPLGMITVTWSVDPSDWRMPGTAAITQRVLSAAHPGSIVVLHDGGGNRGETLAALPSIVKGLQHRGMRVVSVQQLLHLTPR